MSTSGRDTISSGDDPERLPPARRRPSAPTAGTRTTALTAALTLVLAGGVATAAYRSSTDSTDPTTLIPASAFAVATVDLDAPGDALGTFADHFPGSPTHDGDGSAVERLLRGMFRDSEDPHVDYDKDLAPWLGDRLAVAAWLDADEHPQVEWLVESRDDGSARKDLEPLLKDGEGLVFESGYAVIADSSAMASAALRAADHAAIADDARYAADVGALPADEAVVGWLDGAGAKQALTSAMNGFGSPQDVLGQSPFLMMSGDPFQQRVAIGLHVTDRYVQADMRTYGAPAGAAAPATLLTELPTGTIGAVAFAGADRFVDTMFGFMREFAGFGGTSQSCSGSIEGTFPPTPTLGEVPADIPHRRAIMRNQRKMLRIYKRQMIARSPSSGGFSCTTDEPADPIAEVEQMTGLALPGDVKTLLGDRLVVAFGGLNLTGPPDLALRTHPDDVSAARPIAEKLAAALGAASGFQLSVETPDDELVLATSPAYAKQVAASGSLGADDAFTTVMADLPEQISSAVFVDLTRVWPLITAQGDDVGGAVHLHAFGMWTARDGDVQVAQLRLVAG